MEESKELFSLSMAQITCEFGTISYLNQNSSITLTNILVENIYTVQKGGLVYVDVSELYDTPYIPQNVTLKGDIILQNILVGGQGGVIYIDGKDITLNITEAKIKSKNLQSYNSSAFMFLNITQNITFDNLQIDGIVCKSGGCVLEAYSSKFINITNSMINCVNDSYNPDPYNQYSIQTLISASQSSNSDPNQFRGSAFLLQSQELFSSFNQFKNCLVAYQGGVFQVKDSNLTDINSTFINNSAYKGGAIYAFDSNVTLQNTTFDTHYAVLGGTIYILESSLLTFYNLFANVTLAYQNGGFLSLEMKEIDYDAEPQYVSQNYSVVKFMGNTKIKNILAHFKGGVLYSKNINAQVYLNDTGIISNSVTAFKPTAVFGLRNSWFYEDGSIYRNNKCQYKGCVVACLYCELVTITNAIFNNNSAVDNYGGEGGLFYFIAHQEDIIMTNLTILNTKSEYGNGGVLTLTWLSDTPILEQKLLYIQNVSVVNAFSGSNGGFAYISSNNTKIVIKDSYFENVTAKFGGVLDINCFKGCLSRLDFFTNFEVDNITVSNLSAVNGSLIHTTNYANPFGESYSKILVLNSNFTNIQAKESGAGFYVTNAFTREINLTNNYFENLTAQYGSMFYLDQMNGSLNIGQENGKNIFKNISANVSGTFLYSISNSFDLNLQYSQIQCQETYQSNVTNLSLQPATIQGVFLIDSARQVTSSNNQISNCQQNMKSGAFTLTNTKFSDKNSVYVHNYAEQGAIYYFNNIEYDIEDCTYNENYGSYGTVFYLLNNINNKLKNVTITNNEAKYQGGVFYLVKSSILDINQNLTLNGESLRLLSNNSANQGGVIYSASTDAQINLDSCLIQNSTAYESGGVIFIADAKLVKFYNTTIQKSYSIQGGILYSQSYYVEIQLESSLFQCLKDPNEFSLTQSQFYIQSAGKITSNSNQFYDCESNVNSGFFSLRSTNFQDNSSIFARIKGINGGVFWALNSELDFTNSTFANNTAVQAGAIQITDFSTLSIDQCKFFNNTAIDKAGVVSILTNSAVKIKNSIFEENSSGGETSTIDTLDSSKLEDVLIHNCTFRHNRAAKNALTFMYSRVKISNCTFFENYATENSMNIFAGFSNISIEDSIFNQTLQSLDKLSTYETSGTYINVILQVNMTVNNCTFLNGQAQQGGAIIIDGKSDVIIQNSLFKNNQAYTLGGAISGNSFKSLTILNNTFYDNYAQEDGDEIYVTNSKNILKIENVFISNSVGKESIAIEMAQVHINNLTVKDIQAINTSNSQGAGLKCTNCKSLLINSSFFSNISSQTGGAIYIEEQEGYKISSISLSSPRYLITNSIISDSTSLIGGGIYLTNIQQITINSTQFLNNIACNQSQLDQSKTVGSGGAIFYTCDEVSKNCKLDISNNNTFKNNFAFTQGGAINWDTLEPTFSKSLSTFYNNSALLYGDDIASFGQNLQVISEEQYLKQFVKLKLESQTNSLSSRRRNLQSQIQEINHLLKSNARNLQNSLVVESSSFTVQQQQSGSSIPTTYIALMDKYGQIVGTSSDSKVLVFVNTSYNTDPKANVYPPVIEGSNTFLTSGGVLVIEDLQFTGTPTYNYSILLQTDVIDQTKQSNIDYMNSTNQTSLNFKIQISLRECLLGEQFNVAGKCQVCVNSYSLEKQTSPGSCNACPTQKATCLGGSKIYPQQGYWRKSNQTATIIRCLYPEACLGTQDDTQTPLGECFEGYQGILCSDCQEGFSRSGENRCQKCPAKALNIVRIIFIIIGVIALIIFLVRSTLNSAHNKHNITNIYSKILLNHFQLIMMTSTFDFNWSQLILDYFNSTKQVATVSTQIFSFDCLIDKREFQQRNSSDIVYQYSPLDISSNIRITFVKIILISVLPLMLMTFSIIGWWFYKIIFRKAINLFSRVISTLVIVLFLSHPSIVQYMFLNFKCKDIDGEERLLNDLEVVCWDSQHSIYSYYFAIPSIIIWVLGIPFFALILLIKVKKQLDDIEVRRKLGFLYRGYRQIYFYWEILIMYRKVIIIFIAIFVKAAGVIAQALVVFIVLVMQVLISQIFYFSFLMINTSKHPFVKKALNDLENLSLSTSMITIYCGIFFVINKPKKWIEQNPDYSQGAVSLSEEVQSLFFAVILISNIIFFSYWSYKMFEELRSQIRKRFTRIYLICCLCRNSQLLEKELLYQEVEQINLENREHLILMSQRLLNLYNSGKLKLTQSIIQRLEKHLNEDLLLKVAGIEGNLNSIDELRSFAQKHKISYYEQNIPKSMESLRDRVNEQYQEHLDSQKGEYNEEFHDQSEHSSNEDNSKISKNKQSSKSSSSDKKYDKKTKQYKKRNHSSSSNNKNNNSSSSKASSEKMSNEVVQVKMKKSHKAVSSKYLIDQQDKNKVGKLQNENQGSQDFDDNEEEFNQTKDKLVANNKTIMQQQQKKQILSDYKQQKFLKSEKYSIKPNSKKHLRRDNFMNSEDEMDDGSQINEQNESSDNRSDLSKREGLMSTRRKLVSQRSDITKNQHISQNAGKTSTNQIIRDTSKSFEEDYNDNMRYSIKKQKTNIKQRQ
eukprot:403370625